MQTESRRIAFRRRMRTGIICGANVAIFDAMVFFALFDGLRESTRSLLGKLMEPLLLGLPLAVTVACLVGWAVTYVLPGWGDRVHQ